MGRRRGAGPYRGSPARLLRRLGAAAVAVVAFASATIGGRPASAAEVQASPAGEPESLRSICDGKRDAAAVLAALYEERARGGGGAIVVPAGRTCRLEAPVRVRSGVRLRCAPGARLIAALDGGVALFGSGLRDVEIRDCELHLQGRTEGAIDLSGEDLAVHSAEVRQEAEPRTARALVRLACEPRGRCDLHDSEVVCSSQLRSNEPAVAISAAGRVRAGIRQNEVHGCRLGLEVSGMAAITGNRVDAGGGSSPVALRFRPGSEGAEVSGNRLSARGEDAIGIDLAEGDKATLDRNRVAVSGARAVAFSVEGFDLQLVGNSHSIDGTDAIGYLPRGSSILISSCSGEAHPKKDGQIHVAPLHLQQLVVTGCILRRGAFAVAEKEPATSINVTVSSSRLIGMTSACVVVSTGFLVNGNYCAWLGEKAHALVIGDDRPPGTGNSHAVVSGNLLHCAGCRSLVVPTRIGGRCGPRAKRACEEDSDCDGGACQMSKVRGVVFSANSLLGTAKVGLDFGVLEGRGTPIVSDWIIDGNQFGLLGDCTAIRFPNAAQPRQKIRDLRIGTNSNACPTYLENHQRGFEAPEGECRP